MADKAEIPDDLDYKQVEKLIAGKPNPEYFRRRRASVTKRLMDAIEADQPIPFNLEAASKMLERDEILHGLDAKTLADARSEGDKLRDFHEALADDPQSIYEQVEETLAIAEREMDFVDSTCKELIDDKRVPLTESDKVKQEDKRFTRKGKDWPGLLARVRRVQARAKNPVPPSTPTQMTQGCRAALPLRFMVYVNRSSTMKLHKGSRSNQFKMARHHCVFAVDTWEARNGVTFPDKGKNKGLAVEGGRDPFKIVLLIAPPGHNKSEFAMNYLGLEFALRPDTLAMYLHAVEDEAVKNKGYIARMFDPAQSTGRRCRALFPNIPRFTKKDNNEATMRFALKDEPKSPSLRAAGVMSAKLGADTKLLVLDDIVPQSDADEPTTRERRFDVVSGTFGTRQRGVDTFIICIGTIWHHADCLSKFRKMADDRKSDVILCSVQTCGGPSTSPPFYPLWPDAYPAAELRKRFEVMNRNHSLWSAAYEANPLAAADRMVRKLRYYDPTSQEHLDFLASAQMHVSVDPTATNKETSDHAGIVYAGLGEVSAVQDQERIWQKRLRVIDATKVHANQVELSERVAVYTLQRPVYQVHVETRSGFHATADILESTYGLEVQRHDPTNNKKGVRLREVAGLIDDSSPAFRALVEFPGMEMPDKTIGPDPRWKFLYEQILDFGVCGEDEFVDTLSQLVKFFNRTGDLVGGTGEASEMVRTALAETGDPRVLALLRSYENPPPNMSVDEEDAQWLMER